MPTLYLSAPGTSQADGDVRTFDVATIFAEGVAPDYAVSNNLIEQVTSGMNVVVFDRNRLKQLEGILRSYSSTTKAGNGLQRYDFHIAERRMVAYSNPPNVNHCGVGVG
jgi:hypothetical protein